MDKGSIGPGLQSEFGEAIYNSELIISRENLIFKKMTTMMVLTGFNNQDDESNVMGGFCAERGAIPYTHFGL